MRQRCPRRWPPESLLIEYESVSRSPGEAVDRRTFLKVAAGTLTAFSAPGLAEAGGATLYNGIRLPAPWTPVRRGFLPTPVTPPYLVDRPAVVPIDIGRQLFVDDFLVEESSLERVFHLPDYHPASPILRPTTSWEKRDEYAERTNTRSNPAAIPFSDGVFWDPESRLFKMWYMGGYSQNTCLALSHDGLEWNRPTLDVVKGTNITIAEHRDSSTVWLDLEDPDASRRYKMASWYDKYLLLYTSADGIHWRKTGQSGAAGDRTTFFHNPFRKVWIFSSRDQNLTIGRFRRYAEARDFERAGMWTTDQPVEWVAADADDPRRPEYNVPVEVYNLDGVAYESLVLGLFTMFRGERPEREKPNEICVGFSRDGFHWDRPDRLAFIPVSEHVGDWNWANVQSAGGCCLVMGDRLHFYVSGRAGVPGTRESGVCTTGLATLRRDGFASLDAGDQEGTLTTRPITFDGKRLFVNAAAKQGGLEVEVLGSDGRVIEPFSRANCQPFHGDATLAEVRWKGA